MKKTDIVDNTYSDISGVVLFEWMESQIILRKEVELDFAGATPMSAIFHEKSFYNIYRKYGEREFKKHIKIINI